MRETRLFAAFYGDDFTGSVENLAQYQRHGLRGRLYFSAEHAERVFKEGPGLEVVGLAGVARSLPTEAIGAEVLPALEILDRLNPTIRQFKICSTLDSSPAIGSIGHVMELACQRTPGLAVLVHAATPGFGRYTVFGHHFTQYQGAVLRLDENPAMAYHPSTPMGEANIAKHLSRQTSIPFSHLSLLDLKASDADTRLENTLDDEQSVVIDSLTEQDVEQVGRLVMKMAVHRPVLAVAAQGLACGLGAVWAAQRRGKGSVGVSADVSSFGSVERMLILSGSCSPQSQMQLEVLRAAGGTIVPINPAALIDDPQNTTHQLLTETRHALGFGALVALATTSNPNDRRSDIDGALLAQRLGEVFAIITRAAVMESGVKRVVFAGGDSSSLSMRALGANAIDIIAFDAQQGGHLCTLRADDSVIDGIEVILKGGQIGKPDFFLHAASGIR